MNRSLFELLTCPYSKSSLTLESFEANGDEIEYGKLRSEAGEYPIIAGIPILFLGRTDLLERLQSGRHREALALAAIGPAPSAGVWRLTGWLQDTYRLRGLGKRLEKRRQSNWLRRVEQATTSSNGPVTARQLFDFAYREANIRSSEVFNYNYYRYSIPRHLVALSFVHAMQPKGPVLDLACGAGHITWAIRQRLASEHEVIGLDGFFFSLYVARSTIATGAQFVCGDISALPFPNSSLSTVFCSDAFFNFSAKWSSLREMERTLDAAGTIMLVCLTNKLKEHIYPGRPLTPTGYRTLVNHLPNRLFPDSLILQHYLRGYGLPAGEQVDDEMLNREDRISILASKAPTKFADKGRFETWPHAAGLLGINPLYVSEPSSDETTPSDARYVRRFPSDFYAQENREINLYLPEHLKLSREQQVALSNNAANEMEDLIQSFAVLGFPPNYLT